MFFLKMFSIKRTKKGIEIAVTITIPFNTQGKA